MPKIMMSQALPARGASALSCRAPPWRGRRRPSARHDRMADIEFDDFSDRGDRLDVVIVEAVAGIHRETQRGRRTSPRCAAARIRVRGPPRWPRRRRRCAVRSAGAPARRAASICAGSGSMNSDTRMPRGAKRRRRRRRSALLCPQHVEPPSVVISWRDSGTRQHILRRVRSGDADHLVGYRHLEIHAGLQGARASPVTSRSWMWRRSSRRCSVMLSAPASSASRAAYRGSG